MLTYLRSFNRELIYYWVISSLWSWLFWLLLILSSNNLINLEPFIAGLLFYLAFYGPLFACLLLLYLENKVSKIKEFLSSIFLPPFSKKWFSSIIVIIITLDVLAFMVGLMAKENWLINKRLDNSFIIPVLLIVLSLSIPTIISWFGFFFKKIQEGRRFIISVTIMTLFWLGWWLPTFFISDTIQFQTGILVFVLWMFLLNIIMGLLFINSNYNVLPVIILYGINLLVILLFPFWLSDYGIWLHITSLVITIGLIEFYSFGKVRIFNSQRCNS